MTHNYQHTVLIEESTMIHFDLRDQRELLVCSKVSYIDISWFWYRNNFQFN